MANYETLENCISDIEDAHAYMDDALTGLDLLLDSMESDARGVNADDTRAVVFARGFSSYLAALKVMHRELSAQSEIISKAVNKAYKNPKDSV